MRVGWTLNWLASSLTVRSPLSAARATWALNAGVWTLRFRDITATPFLAHQCSLTGGPVFGVHYRLNHDLVAIIGNRGNGKSALADMLGLAGRSKNHAHFS